MSIKLARFVGAPTMATKQQCNGRAGTPEQAIA
jgi:hypothetical protein